MALLVFILSSFFSTPSFGPSTPQDDAVAREVAYNACFSTDDPQTCIDNLDD